MRLGGKGNILYEGDMTRDVELISRRIVITITFMVGTVP